MAKGIYVGADNVARKVKKMYVGVDGIARRVKKAYIGVAGVARQYYDSYGIKLRTFVADTCTDVTITYNETDIALTADIRGRSTAGGWSQVTWRLYNDNNWLLLNPGDKVTFSYTGTRSGDYTDYGLIFFKPGSSLANAYENRIECFYNFGYDTQTYIVTEACQVMFICQIAGSESANRYATINITDFRVNDERIWVEL